MPVLCDFTLILGDSVVTIGDAMPIWEKMFNTGGRESGKVDTGRVCMECKNAYRHRQWDPVHRDWIS